MAKRSRPGDPKLAIVYIRCSTDKQELSPGAQGAALDAWAAREGVTVLATFFDLGVSGTTGLEERPGLVGALAALRAFGAGLLGAANRSRVARDIEVIRSVEREAVKGGAVLRTADGASSDDGDTGHIRKGFDDLLNEAEVRRTRARTKAALAVKKARGERVGTIPFGFRLAADGVKLEPSSTEQAVVERVIELAEKYAMSTRQIVTQLKLERLPGRMGNLAQPQVHRILARHRAHKRTQAA